MSDENTPKLRLRPKLAGGPPPITPAPLNPPPPLPEEVPSEESASEPLAVWPESKATPPRAKLSLKPEVPAAADGAASLPKSAPLTDPAPAWSPVPMSGDSPDPKLFSPPTPAKPLLVPRKPAPVPPEEVKSRSDSGATPPFVVDLGGEKKLPAVLNAPPPPRIKLSIPASETWPAVLDAPPPAGLSPVTASPFDKEGEPAEITAIRKASTFPFPAPTAKFPPLPGLGTSVGTEPTEAVAPEGFLKKLLLIGAVVFLLLAGGAAFAYFKFFAKPKDAAAPEVPPAQAEAQPQPTPSSKVKQMMAKAQEEQLAPLNEVLVAEPAPAPAKPVATSTPPATAQVQAAQTSPAPSATPVPEVVTTPPPAPVKPPPPAPSLAFKAWVINLKIRGVRGGDAQRVFIDKTSYVPGDVVNQQLGIIFTGYDESTRMLSFQDKTGARFERRH